MLDKLSPDKNLFYRSRIKMGCTRSQRKSFSFMCTCKCTLERELKDNYHPHNQCFFSTKIIHNLVFNSWETHKNTGLVQLWVYWPGHWTHRPGPVLILSPDSFFMNRHQNAHKGMEYNKLMFDKSVYLAVMCKQYTIALNISVYDTLRM